MHILWLILIGFVAGVIAKFLHPGRNEPAGFILTTALKRDAFRSGRHPSPFVPAKPVPAKAGSGDPARKSSTVCLAPGFPLTRERTE